MARLRPGVVASCLPEKIRRIPRSPSSAPPGPKFEYDSKFYSVRSRLSTGTGRALGGAVRVRSMLYRYAEVNSGGLTVVGGGANTVPFVPQAVVQLYLATTAYVPWIEADIEHRLMIALLHEDALAPGGVEQLTVALGPQPWLAEGDPNRGKIHRMVKVGRRGDMSPGEDIADHFVVLVNRALPGPGDYRFSFQLDRADNEIERVSFRAFTLPTANGR